MRNYLKHEIKVGDVYTTDAFGKTEVVFKHDNNHFEVKPLHNPNEYQFGHNYIVDSFGRFGLCYNNPQSLLMSDK